MDIAIEDISSIINGGSELVILENKYSEIEKDITLKKSQLDLLKNSILSVKENYKMKYKTEIKILPECIVYYRHGVIKTMSGITEFILGAGEECGKNNPDIKCVLDYCYITYTAEEYQDKDIELEYCQAVDRFGKESENIKLKKIDSVKALCVNHKGAFSKLNEAYAFAISYIEQNGYKIADKIRECYIHGCWDGKKEEDYLTQIQIPIV
jgi:effector-binding domain-containing protein